MRYKILRFLHNRVSGRKEGDIAPKWIQFIYWCLFPLNWFYEKQSDIKYDALRDIYTIRGRKFSGNFFDAMANTKRDGEIFMIESNKGSDVKIRTMGNAKRKPVFNN